MKIDLKAIGSEFLGTLGLTLAVLTSINNPDFPIPTAVLAGLTLGLFVYTVGKYSGAHLNPAITVGAAVLKKIRPTMALYYISAQFLGAASALILTDRLVGGIADQVAAKGTGEEALAEIIGTFILAFGIASVIFGTTTKEASGLVIGGSLLLGVSIAAIASNGALNPAVAYGIGSLNVTYVLGPIVGSILGFTGYALISGDIKLASKRSKKK